MIIGRIKDLILRSKHLPAYEKKNVRWVRPDASFRERADLVQWANALLASSEGQALQAYLFAAIPQNLFYRGDRIDNAQAGLEYMRLAGYMECLQRLQEAGRILPMPAPEIEADYDQTPPEQPEP